MSNLCLFELYLSITGLIFEILSEFFQISLRINVSVATYYKHSLSSLLMGFIVAFLLFIHPGESIYDPI